MSSLITKYRPDSFDNVVGHKSVVKSLRTVLSRKSSQSFVLVGPSGIGKTTIARIIAKEVGVSQFNLMEIDAATHTGVDAMRAAMETLPYATLGNGSKMVIIDEAHSLSKAAWDSCLKIVEEPPPHVYFCFCTTIQGKIPVTISTRCTTVSLKPINKDDIFDLLEKVVKAEQFKTSEAVLTLIAAKCEGSPRRALAWLASCSECTNRKVAARLLEQTQDEDEVINLSRDLMRGASWDSLQERLVNMKDSINPEGARIQIFAYFSQVLLGSKSDAVARKALTIMECFSDPFPQGASIGHLLLCIGEVYFAS